MQHGDYQTMIEICKVRGHKIFVICKWMTALFMICNAHFCSRSCLQPCYMICCKFSFQPTPAIQRIDDDTSCSAGLLSRVSAPPATMLSVTRSELCKVPHIEAVWTRAISSRPRFLRKACWSLTIRLLKRHLYFCSLVRAGGPHDDA